MSKYDLLRATLAVLEVAENERVAAVAKAALNQLPPMPQSSEPKRPPGRPEVPEQERLIVGSIRLTQAQWDKLAKLGGAEWLRERINRAKVKNAPER